MEERLSLQILSSLKGCKESIMTTLCQGLDHLDEMPIPWKTQHVRATQDAIENIFIQEIELIIKILPTKKAPGPDGSAGEICQRLKREIT